MKTIKKYLCILCGITKSAERDAYLQGVKMGYWINEHKDSFSDADLAKYGLTR